MNEKDVNILTKQLNTVSCLNGNEVLPWSQPKPLIKLMSSVILDRRLIGGL